jgi:hypothetical protein
LVFRTWNLVLRTRNLVFRIIKNSTTLDASPLKLRHCLKNLFFSLHLRTHFQARSKRMSEKLGNGIFCHSDWSRAEGRISIIR